MIENVITEHAKNILKGMDGDRHITLYGKPIMDYTKKELAKFIGKLYLEKVTLQCQIAKLEVECFG